MRGAGIRLKLHQHVSTRQNRHLLNFTSNAPPAPYTLMNEAAGAAVRIELAPIRNENEQLQRVAPILKTYISTS
jgi:hypothetical protein